MSIGVWSAYTARVPHNRPSRKRTAQYSRVYCGLHYKGWLKIWKCQANRRGLLRRFICRICGYVLLICCHPNRAPLRRVISIQCYALFRAWRRLQVVPLAQSHSYPHHLANYFRFLRVLQNAD